MNQSISPIFILGAPRSGTTLLSFMLDSHPNIAIGRESFFMLGVRYLMGDVPEEMASAIGGDL